MKNFTHKFIGILTLVFAMCYTVNAQFDYVILMYDSYGDGWNGATYELVSNGNGVVVASGSLISGNSGIDSLYLPLPNDCYTLNVGGGNWDNEISWAILSSLDGELASGGAPSSVEFCVGAVDGSCQDSQSGFNFDGDSSTVWILEYDENCNGDSYLSEIIYSHSGTTFGSASYGINWFHTCNGTYIHTYNSGNVVYNGVWDGNQISGTFTNPDNTFSGCFTLKKMGCTDALASNYDPSAFINNNSCSYECGFSSTILSTNSGEYDEEIGLVITSSLNDTIFAFSQNNLSYSGFGVIELIEGVPAYNAGDFNVCLDPQECYTIRMTDYYGDGWNGAYFTLNDETFSLPSGSEISYNYGVACEDQICADSLYNYELSQNNSFGVSVIDFNSGQTLYSVPGGSTGEFCLNSEGCYIFQLSNATGVIDSSNVDYLIFEDQEYYFDQGEVVGGGAYSELDPYLRTFSDILETGCIVSGCTDSLSDNFNEMAVVNDGSCQLYEVGCMDSLAFNYNNQALLDDGSCEPIIEGCTDPNALNYNPDAQVDDGSCATCTPVSMEMNDSFGDGWNGATYSIVDASGDLVASGGFTTGSSATDDLCLVDGCYTITAGGGDYDYEISWTLGDLASGFRDPVNFSLNGDCEFAILGCTEPGTDNYDPAATEDDGSCSCPLTPAGVDVTETDCYNAVTYYSYSISEMTELGYDCTCVEYPIFGCTDPLANNYNPLANLILDDDCVYTIDCNTPFVHNASLINYENNSNISWNFTSDNGEDLKIDFAGATNDGEPDEWADCWGNGNGYFDYIKLYQPGELDAMNVSPGYHPNPSSIYGYCLENFSSIVVPSGTTLVFSSDDTGTEAFSFSVSLNVEGCDDTVTACMDLSAANYNAIADIADDSLCEYNGCTDLLALNYDSSATQDDSSCIYVIEGCMDSLACNYNDVATEDNGSCYNNDLGCGCDLPAASDGYDCDGNCLSGELLTMTADYGDPTVNWLFYDGPGGGGLGFGWYGAVLTINGVDYTLESGLAATTCIDLLDCNTVSWTTYDSDVFASSFIGGVPDGVSMSAAWSVGDLSGGNGSGSGAYGDCGITGCTDVLASNFDSFANFDDGSCVSWEELANSLQSELDNVVIEDGVSQEDVDAAYIAGAASVELPECEEVATQNIPLDLPQGWSMFGYTCLESLDVVESFSDISDKIEIVKDEWGLAYLPAWGFSAFDNLEFGEGYQIKMIEEVTDFQFCSTVTGNNPDN